MRGLLPIVLSLLATGTALAGTPTTPAGHPEKCEVEIGGVVRYPDGKAPPGKAVVLVAEDGDCMKEGAKILGQVAVQPEGTFFIEVFSRWGADLTICAAHLAPGSDRSTLRGKASGAFHAAAVGEVTFSSLKIDLRQAPPLRIPAPKAR